MFIEKQEVPAGSPLATAGQFARAAFGSVPPTGLVVLGIITTQLGAAIAKQLFPALGPGGTVLLRVGFAAITLLLAWRPRLGTHRARDYAVAALFGVVLGVMNFTFYSALDRIPLGVAVTIEFIGPLGVAVAGSRRPLDLVWVALAGSGVVLLSPWTGAALDPIGVLLAVIAGGCWASYILLSAWVGQLFPGGAGLALAMSVAAILLAPVGIMSAGASLLRPPLLLAGLGAALLSSVIPYSLELEALRKLPTKVFGILMSVEPAIAGIIGFLVLREALSARALIAMGCVTLATLGSTRQGSGAHEG